MPSILPQLRSDLVRYWRDRQTADEWRSATAFASTPAGRKLLLQFLSEYPPLLAATRRAIHPLFTADRAGLYARVAAMAQTWQRRGIPAFTRPRGTEE
jgi:hypothetical protein